MNLYELTEEAVGQFGTYRSPNLDDWIEEIDKVLIALGESTISNDKIEDLYFTDDTLEIKTSYSVRCCECSNDMSIPIEILKDENPVKKATQLRLLKELDSAKYDVSQAQLSLNQALDKLEKSQKNYDLEKNKELA